MGRIDLGHPIFESPEYRRDIEQFFILEAIKPTAKLLVSDGESYVVCSSLVPHLAAWIWTADGISQARLDRLRDELRGVFNDDYQPCISAKPEVAEFLARDYGTPTSSILMTAYVCPAVAPARSIDGDIRGVGEEDVEDVALFVRDFEAECFGREPMEREKAVAEARKMVRNKWSFVVSRGGKPVAFAKSAKLIAAGYISINNVYTLPEYRGRGYAAALVAHVSRLILDSGSVPLLYADAANPASNKAYRNVGFLPRGRILNLDFGGLS